MGLQLDHSVFLTSALINENWFVKLDYIGGLETFHCGNTWRYIYFIMSLKPTHGYVSHSYTCKFLLKP